MGDSVQKTDVGQGLSQLFALLVFGWIFAPAVLMVVAVAVNLGGIADALWKEDAGRAMFVAWLLIALGVFGIIRMFSKK